jgi:anti-sigma regulatory factor (Ser/Thr protein kinase)
MTDQRTPSRPDFQHEVLIHDDDASLVSATRRFVACGLRAGADVLVHSNRSQVALLQDELGSHERLSYGYDEELYASPTTTLFEYQRQLAARPPGAGELWVTGTVPQGATSAAQAAWARYESAVNEALGTFPLHALCTYDARVTPAAVLATARATHPTLHTASGSVPCPAYRTPTDFLTTPLAGIPQVPQQAPALITRLDALDDVTALRELLRSTVRSASVVPLEAIDSLTLAVHEVVTNAIRHGAPPVSVRVWTDLAETVVQVLDAGPGCLDPLAGYRFPDAHRPLGLWVARHEVDTLIIDSPPGGGCRVLLFKS